MSEVVTHPRFTDTMGTANRLAATIREYWVKHGYLGIDVRVVPEGEDKRRIFPIWSNIGPYGWPPKEKPSTLSPERLAELNKLYTTVGG
jgi:hypothetical protein